MLGMLSDEEIAFLRRYGRESYSGQGAIVDLGCWLGCSTISLIQGLRKNANSRLRSAPVHAYDIFIWEDWMDATHAAANSDLKGRYRSGESFLDEFERHVSPWRDNVKIHAGDLAEIGWSGEPIEFLFIDAMKSWRLAKAIVHNFFPALIPGRSTVVHQDFASHHTYWIHLIAWRLRDYFVPVADVPYSGSLVFKNLAQIPNEMIAFAYDLSSFSDEEIEQAFNYSLTLVAKPKHPHLLAAKLKLYGDRGDHGRFCAAFEQLSRLMYEQLSREANLKRLNQRLESELKGLRRPQQASEIESGRPGGDSGNFLKGLSKLLSLGAVGRRNS